MKNTNNKLSPKYHIIKRDLVDSKSLRFVFIKQVAETEFVYCYYDLGLSKFLLVNTHRNTKLRRWDNDLLVASTEAQVIRDYFK